MINKFNSIFLVLLLFGITACNKKKLPSEENQSPVFYLNGELDGNPIKLEAGNNNYKMNESFDWDTTGVCVFKSTLVEEACVSGCKGYVITVLMNDGKKTIPNSKINLDDCLRYGSYAFNDSDLPSIYYKITLSPKSIKSSSQTYRWEIKDRMSFSFLSYLYCTSTFLNSGQIYSVTLNCNNGIDSTFHTNVFNVGSPLQSTISATLKSSFPSVDYDFSCQASGTPPYRYRWDFDDGMTSVLPNPSHSFSVTLFGRKNVKCTVVDSKNDSCVSYYQTQISADPTTDANFTASFTPIPNSKAYSAITVLITDPDGIVYSSKNLAQPLSSAFDVMEIGDYLENPNHLLTKKIKVKLNCVLSNGTKQIKLSNAELSIALAYSK